MLQPHPRPVQVINSLPEEPRRETGKRLRASAVALLLFAPFLAPGCDANEWPEAEAFAAGTALIFPSDGQQDVEKGVTLISKAADAGNPEAQFALALLYRQGGLLKADPVRARTLLEQSAEKGVDEAQTVLGQEILEGLGEYDDPAEGRALLRTAVEQGNLMAHTYLGTSLLEKVPKNYDEALRLLKVAAEGGIVDAQLMLGIAYTNGGGLYRSQAPRDHERGFHWISRAAEGGSPLAWTWVGWAYQGGHAVPQDLEKAAQAWQMAAELGDAPGANALSLAYRDGVGMPKDRRMEQFWKRRAAELGHRGAQEVIEREARLAKQQRDNALAVLVLLGLALGASGGDHESNTARFMDPSDPMQAWGMDIMMRIK